LLFSFQYLDMVIKETLRKYPILPGMLRKCNKAYKIPGSDLIIPEGKNVLIPIYSIHHDPEFYPMPNIFDPDRFTLENIESRNPITYLAFGEGPRSEKI
jgi:cytochrome P450 family 6